ncbi:DUF551 domain-containing protein [Neptuniibacter sp. QD37_11]|uniref:DUF551 domain-containing protein n=1 Tax=Neptuniibacter sp. QD37_11 TaxID=3398209 RepID=UPI0039F45080
MRADVKFTVEVVKGWDNFIKNVKEQLEYTSFNRNGRTITCVADDIRSVGHNDWLKNLPIDLPEKEATYIISGTAIYTADDAHYQNIKISEIKALQRYPATSVEDAMPELGEKVIILYEGWEDEDYDGSDFDHTDVCPHSGDEYFVNASQNEDKVTHWMYVPSRRPKTSLEETLDHVS